MPGRAFWLAQRTFLVGALLTTIGTPPQFLNPAPPPSTAWLPPAIAWVPSLAMLGALLAAWRGSALRWFAPEGRHAVRFSILFLLACTPWRDLAAAHASGLANPGIFLAAALLWTLLPDGGSPGRCSSGDANGQAHPDAATLRASVLRLWLPIVLFILLERFPPFADLCASFRKSLSELTHSRHMKSLLMDPASLFHRGGARHVVIVFVALAGAALFWRWRGPARIPWLRATLLISLALVAQLGGGPAEVPQSIPPVFNAFHSLFASETLRLFQPYLPPTPELLLEGKWRQLSNAASIRRWIPAWNWPFLMIVAAAVILPLSGARRLRRGLAVFGGLLAGCGALTITESVALPFSATPPGAIARAILIGAVAVGLAWWSICGYAIEPAAVAGPSAAPPESEGISLPRAFWAAYTASLLLLLSATIVIGLAFLLPPQWQALFGKLEPVSLHRTAEEKAVADIAIATPQRRPSRAMQSANAVERIPRSFSLRQMRIYSETARRQEERLLLSDRGTSEALFVIRQIDTAPRFPDNRLPDSMLRMSPQQYNALQLMASTRADQTFRHLALGNVEAACDALSTTLALSLRLGSVRPFFEIANDEGLALDAAITLDEMITHIALREPRARREILLRRILRMIEAAADTHIARGVLVHSLRELRNVPWPTLDAYLPSTYAIARDRRANESALVLLQWSRVRCRLLLAWSESGGGAAVAVEDWKATALAPPATPWDDPMELYEGKRFSDFLRVVELAPDDLDTTRALAPGRAQLSLRWEPPPSGWVKRLTQDRSFERVPHLLFPLTIEFTDDPTTDRLRLSDPEGPSSVSGWGRWTRTRDNRGNFVRVRVEGKRGS